jgi:hypothetical protein
VAAAVLWLTSDIASFTTGSLRLVDGVGRARGASTTVIRRFDEAARIARSYDCQDRGHVV